VIPATAFVVFFVYVAVLGRPGKRPRRTGSNVSRDAGGLSGKATTSDDGPIDDVPWLLTRSHFDAMWIPRVGTRAASELRHNGHLRLAAGPIYIAAGIVFGAFELGRPHTTTRQLIGVAALVLLAAFYRQLIRSQTRFAELLSDWFGTRIERTDLPKLRPKLFDRWSGDRGYHPAQHEADAQPLEHPA
jgi:hypothetical protein